jgi:hypothetical protein
MLQLHYGRLILTLLYPLALQLLLLLPPHLVSLTLSSCRLLPLPRLLLLPLPQVGMFLFQPLLLLLLPTLQGRKGLTHHDGRTPAPPC